MGTVFENKVPQKSKFSKYTFGKSWSPSPIFFKEIFLERFDQFSSPKNDFENQNFEVVVHNFGKSDGDIIY